MGSIFPNYILIEKKKEKKKKYIERQSEVKEREGIYMIWFNDGLFLRGKPLVNYMFSFNMEKMGKCPFQNKKFSILLHFPN